MRSSSRSSSRSTRPEIETRNSAECASGPVPQGHRARCSASGCPQLLDRPLAGRQGLLLPPDAGLLVVLAAAQLVHQPRLLALLLEALQSAFEGLVFLDLDARQRATLLARTPSRSRPLQHSRRLRRLRRLPPDLRGPDGTRHPSAPSSVRTGALHSRAVEPSRSREIRRRPASLARPCFALLRAPTMPHCAPGASQRRLCSRAVSFHVRARCATSPGTPRRPGRIPLHTRSQPPNFLIKRALELEAGGMYLTLKWSAIHRRSRFSMAWNTCRQARRSLRRARPSWRAAPRCAVRCASPGKAHGRAP